MLSGIFSKKTDHPMADIKSAQALLSDLPKNDVYKSLMELSEWVESVTDNTNFRPDHQFAVLRLLDETAQPYVRKLAYDYFTPRELNKFQENRLWLVLDNWHRHTARAYYAVFKRYYNGDKGFEAIHAQLPLLAARVVSAMAGQLKYICAHYSPIDSSFWCNLAQLYLHAEQRQYLDMPLSLYSGVTDNTTVKSELGRLLFWFGCGINTLKPLYMHLTERIAGQYSSSIEISTQQDGNSLFGFDLNQPAAPIHAKPAAHVSMRFVGIAKMQPKLSELIKILSKGVIPKNLNLGGIYDADLVREATQYLLDYLNAPPTRHSVRHGIKAGLNIVNGFARMIQHTDVELDFSADLPAYWDAENISTSGFCAVLPAQCTDGIQIGSLLGVQPDGVPYWGAAVVRRLMRDDTNRLHVGAEMLAHQFFGVSLSRRGAGGGFEDGQPALWLQAKPDIPSNEVRLLMQAGVFTAHRSLQTRLNGRNYLLIPEKLQAKGLDYDLANFRIIEQEQGTEE